MCTCDGRGDQACANLDSIVLDTGGRGGRAQALLPGLDGPEGILIRGCQLHPAPAITFSVSMPTKMRSATDGRCVLFGCCAICTEMTLMAHCVGRALRERRREWEARA
jgi:hypothetical protein